MGWEKHLGQIISYLKLRGASCHKTYKDMCDTWLDSKQKIPTKAECEQIFNEHIKPKIEAGKKKQQMRDELFEENVTSEAKTEALWEKIMNNEPAQANLLKEKEDTIKNKYK